MNNSPLQKGIYVHGLGSGANTDTLQSVQKHLPMFDWYAVEVNEDLAQSVIIINAAIETYRPYVLLGTSLGGLYLMYVNVGEAYRIICNPACNIADLIRNSVGFGVKDYFVPRQDGIQQYILDEGVCRRFEELIQTHKPTFGKHDYALFCIHDELIGPEGVLSNQAICFNGGYTILIERKEGHRLGSRALKLIRKQVFINTMTVNKMIGINKEQEEIESNRIKELAEKGDTESQYSMGLHCLYAEDEPANYKEAEKWLWLAAEQGHCDAQYDLGCLYLFGKGVRKDFEEAIDWLKKSVANGNPTYQFRLGYAYFCYGDYCEAAKWIRLSAEQGEQYAQVSLGSLYLHGTGVIKDEEEAMKWFRLAAKQGNKNAKFEVRKYNRRKAGLPEETEGCENITSTLYHPDSEKMEIDSESFFSKAKEIQEFFVENGIPMTFK